MEPANRHNLHNLYFPNDYDDDDHDDDNDDDDNEGQPIVNFLK